jgi:glycerol-3-phosphate acyltransferase PlsY
VVGIGFVLLGYLCGAIPSGVLFARAAGIDVRRAGSGNIGATNVARTAGLRLGLATLAADVAKGFVPVTLAATMPDARLPACTAIAAVLGHVYSPWLHFAGGKGVATAFGASLALYPLATLPTIVLFTIAVVTTRWVSLGSMIAAAAAPFAVLWLGYPRASLLTSIALAVLVVARHRDNLARILSGTEPKFVPTKQASPEK